MPVQIRQLIHHFNPKIEIEDINMSTTMSLTGIRVIPGCSQSQASNRGGSQFADRIANRFQQEKITSISRQRYFAVNYRVDGLVYSTTEPIILYS